MKSWVVGLGLLIGFGVLNTSANVIDGQKVLSGVVAGFGRLPLADPSDQDLVGILRTVSSKDGSQIIERKLSTPPVWDGLAIANGGVFVALKNGRVCRLD